MASERAPTAGEHGDHLRKLIDAAPFAIMEVALDRTVLVWNHAAEELFGWTADEVLGGPLPTTGDDIAREQDDLADVILGGNTVDRVILRRRRKDGREVVIWGAAAPVFNAAGEVTSVIAIGTDVTDQLRLQTELLQGQRMEAVGRLAGGVAHDFNNLLTAILGNVEFLLEDIHDPSQREDLEAIRMAARRGSALTEQLLAVGRRQLVQPEVVDVNEVALAMRPVLRRLFREDVRVSVKGASELSAVEADPAQLEQVLLNLAVNARDAMPAGGELSIKVDNVEIGPGEDHPGGIPPGPYIRVVVQDTGTGMDAATLTHAFDPFFTTKPPGAGTGLGLAAVYGIVIQAGGHIAAQSTPGAGTTFEIHLPRRTEAPGPSAPAQVAGAEGAGERVLLVEDDDAVRAVCEQVLRRAGYAVLVASRAYEALTVARSASAPLDLLVSDVVLPGMDGIELASILSEEQAGLRVLLVSGYAERLSVDGLPEGVDAEVLGKPFSPDDLKRRVRAILDR
ncbi:MAG: response regulator [Actinobacteria bacterium]|nr:response regulator [Actinomycetota bacterium]